MSKYHQTVETSHRLVTRRSAHAAARARARFGCTATLALSAALCSTAALAANAAGSAPTEEIVVTAQKRAERLQEVPISIGVLNGTALEKSGSRAVADQLNQLGGVSLIENEPGQNQVAIRGASANSTFATGSSPVAYYLDEIPFSFINHAIVPDANAFDLERVEVLRGPQGTLYGSSSLNGVVRILTKDASLTGYEVKGRARYGSTLSADDSFSGDLAVNVPIVPGKLAARAVASYADFGGYISTPGKEDANTSKLQNYRFKLNAAPTDRLSIKFGAWIARINNDGPGQSLANYTTPFSNQYSKYDYEAYNLVATYDFDNFSILSSSGYIDLRSASRIEFMPVAPAILAVVAEKDSRVFAQEVRGTSKFEGPWQVTGGVFYRTIDELYDQGVPGLFTFRAINDVNSTSSAVFGELTRSLLDDKVKLTGGLRYFQDSVKTDQTSDLFTGTDESQLLHLKADFHNLTWRAVASYYPTKNFTLYASAATGFRSGLNQDLSAVKVDPTVSLTVGADKMLTEEIGVKSSLLGGKLYYELAAYHEKWDNPQQLEFTVINTNAIVNAPSLSGFGVSGTLSAEIAEGLTFNMSGDWNNLQFDKDLVTNGLVLFAKGERSNTSPEVTASFGTEYRVPVSDTLHAFFAGDLRYNSQMKRHDAVQGARTTSESPQIWYGTIRTGVEAEQWSAAFFVDNVTNENGATVPFPSLFPTAPRFRPLTLGVLVSFKFGS